MLRVLIILAKVVINLTRVVFANRDSPGYSRYLPVDGVRVKIVIKQLIDCSINRLFVLKYDDDVMQW